MEGSDRVFRRVLGSPHQQFWHPMILRAGGFWWFKYVLLSFGVWMLGEEGMPYETLGVLCPFPSILFHSPSTLIRFLCFRLFVGPCGDDDDLPFKISILNQSCSWIEHLHKKHASKNKDSGPSRTRGNDNRILSCVKQAIMIEMWPGREKQVKTCHPSTKHVELL